MREGRLECISVAALQGKRHYMIGGGRNTVAWEEPAAFCPLPGVTEKSVGLDLRCLDGERPSKTEISHTFVSAVVASNDLNRYTRYRDGQVGEGERKIADLGFAGDDYVCNDRCSLSRHVRGGEANLRDPVEKHGGVEYS